MDALIPTREQADGPGRILWLASYPKSGNTWVRMVLGQLLGEPPDGQDINSMASNDGIASGRHDFDSLSGVDSGDLSPDQVSAIRPRVYERISREADRTLFIKAHDAYHPTPRGEPLFPPASTLGVVHIVRNPLDVSVSLAHFLGESLDKTVTMMGNPACVWSHRLDRYAEQLQHRLLDWSGHAASWLDAPLPRLTVRYEDMLARPEEVFLRITRFCGLDAPPEAVGQAVQATRFERLKELEAKQRFREAPSAQRRFFREGQSGGWRGALTPELAARIVHSHGAMMARLGYDPALAA